MNGLKRPVGVLGIERTKLIGTEGKVMVAQLKGASKATIIVVEKDNRHFVIAPERLGGNLEVPADSLTDALHFSVGEMSGDIEKKRAAKKRLAKKPKSKKAGGAGS